MRFEGLEIHKCSYWLERLNILFLVNPETKDVPFISSAMAPDNNCQTYEPYSLQVIRNMLFPEDIDLFNKQLKQGSKKTGKTNLRIRNKQNKPIPFRLGMIKSGPNNINKLLVALPE